MIPFGGEISQSIHRISGATARQRRTKLPRKIAADEVATRRYCAESSQPDLRT
jgi:hypothetical protein